MNSGNGPDRAALGALALLVLVWAYSWIIMKQVMQWSGPFDFAAIRYSGGAVVLLLVMVLRGQSLRSPPWRPTLLIGLCQTTAFQALVQWALVSGGAANVSLLAYTMPIWAVLIAWLLLRDRPNRHQWTGVVLASAGLACIMQPWNGLGSLHSALLAVLGGMTWGAGTVLTKRMFQRWHPSALSLTTWQMIYGSIFLWVVALLVPSRPIEWTPGFIYGLVYSIALASSLAWLLWTFIVDRLPTAVASLSSLAIPVTVVFMAWLILHERPSRVEILGIVLILLGLFVVSGWAGHLHRRSRT